ncbi:ArsR/SmtB family transcription factor [Bacillus cereus]|uniref:ArsR/SmtB family transcription factor n=1 Tax=Bacillus cereus TaxID=1396 RepID=UPI00124C3679|nr:metalloregulator ArsR/SmtB family transcription factor [Bacillus cereus]KAB2397763.1 winged helix-turn-helix transcriptional regulator [Bacillus cereus]
MQKTILEIEKISNVLKLLGDKTRLAMMRMIYEKEYCVCNFVEIFQMSQPSISQHLRKLKDAGLVKEERRGQWIYYFINKESVYYELIQDVISHVVLPHDASTCEDDCCK